MDRLTWFCLRTPTTCLFRGIVVRVGQVSAAGVVATT